MPLFNWPYTNLHSLNLDWIIKKIKNVETAETNTAASEEAAVRSAASAAESEVNAAESETNAAASAAAAGNYYNQIRENVSTLVTGWMDEHITPTTPPVDDTLTIQGAAADAKKTGDEITDLKNALNDSDSREYILDGIYYQRWETGQRYIDSGEEKWTSSSSRMSTKKGTYINFKSGDVVVLKNTLDYQFLVGYSTDNGSTWSGGTNRTSPLTIEADSIGFICIKKASGTFTDDEIKNVAKNKIFILRDGTNIVSDNRQKIDAVTMAMAAFNNSEIVAVDFGMMDTWVSANATSVVTSNKFTESIPAVAGDMFAIKAEVSISYPLLYTGIGIVVYEVSSGGTVVKSTNYTEISDVVEYEVTHSNAAKISVYGYLTAESGSVATGYNEIFDYKLSVAKQMESDLEIFLTENGNAWEV